MTVRDLAKMIGKEGYYIINGLEIGITIKDAKAAYGKVRYLITPLSGLNEIWVELSSLRFL